MQQPTSSNMCYCYFFSEEEYQNFLVNQANGKTRTVYNPYLQVENIQPIDADTMQGELHFKEIVNREDRWFKANEVSFADKNRQYMRGGYLTIDHINFYRIQTYLPAQDHLRVILKHVSEDIINNRLFSVVFYKTEYVKNEAGYVRMRSRQEYKGHTFSTKKEAVRFIQEQWQRKSDPDEYIPNEYVIEEIYQYDPANDNKWQETFHNNN